MAKRSLALMTLVLTGCAAQTASQVPPALSQLAELNHAFATVDPDTAEAIRASAFLRRFANLEVRTTTGTRATWTGRYLYGRQTYIEFFAPDDFTIGAKPAPVGTWGVALSGDRPGFTAVLQQKLAAAGHKALVEVDTRKMSGRDVPWFTALTAISTHGDSGALDATVSAWSMEYVPSYFELPEAGKEPAEGPHDVISRERYQSDSYATKMMRDIVELHFAVGRRDFDRIEPLLRAAGYRIRRSESAVVADGHEGDLRFTITDPQRQGLRQVRFALNKPAAWQVEIIGRSRLVVGPKAEAVWIFDPPR